LIPLLFGLGTATLTMVGVNIGAGETTRARKVAWISALVGVLMTGAIGVVVASFPLAWIALFSHDPDVVREASTYLRIVAPAYAALGFGFVVGFAAQGAGHALWPFVASTVRTLLAAGCGWIAVGYFGAGMTGLAAMVAASLVAYAAICAIVLASKSVWRPNGR
jgi:Na+-driven multidrug efflux pump